MAACVLRGIQYAGIMAVTNNNKGHYQPTNLSFIYIALFFSFMALIDLSYPIGGFIADVYCGRHRTVAASLIFIWVATLLLGIALLITSAKDIDKNSNKNLKLIADIFFALAFIVVIPGLSGFYSNTIQLSLDQLQDAPSNVLGIFLHWCVWVDLLGVSAINILYVVYNGCSRDEKISEIAKNFGYVFTGAMFVLMSILLVLNCFTKNWFNTAEIRYNPYKTVLDVLKYVRTHKYPTRHSAMHWTNGEQPSRFDFAKNCYGGPFTSSQVEDVKTLGRVVIVLLAVGPVFVLCVPTSYIVIFLFSFHTAGHSKTYCSPEWIFVKSGTLSYLLGLISLPIITWIVYCVLKNRVPKILTRMTIGMILFTAGVFSMFVIDLVGHGVTARDTTVNTTHCLFLEDYNMTENLHNSTYFYFKFPWFVLIIPNCFNIISFSLITVTALEFISAQAPQPMKGLVFGIFFAIKGAFVFIANILLIPFSLNSSPVLTAYVNCGTGYLSLTLFVSLVGLVLFACARRWYKYRMRDEEPFSQAVVEEIFERRLQHSAEESPLESPDIVPGGGEERSVSVRRPDRVTESEEERVRASEWFVVNGEGDVRGSEPERLLSLSHDWYGTFQYNDS